MIKAGAKIQYFSNGIARMNTRAGVKSRLAGVSQAKDQLENAVSSAIADAAKNSGVADVLVNSAKADTVRVFNAVMVQIQGGLLQIGSVIRNNMDKSPPLIPVDTGALRQAFKIMPIHFGSPQPKVLLGWPDNKIKRTDPDTGETKIVDMYAAFVHEMTTPPYGPVNWSRPQSGAKFFEAAIKNAVPVIPGIMAEHIKKGGLI